MVTLEASPGVELVMGEPRQSLGHLSGLGFAYRPTLSSGQALDASAPAKAVSWIVRAPAGAGHWVEIKASSPKAGTASRRVPLGR